MLPESVTYNRRSDSPGEGAEQITIPTGLADEGLRKALRFKLEGDNDRFVHIVYAYSDDTFSHGWRVRRAPVFQEEASRPDENH